MEPGVKCRVARAALNMNMQKFADLCGLSKTVIYRIENGKTTPTDRTMGKINRACEKAGVVFPDGESHRPI